jgi:hypothetical protein
VSHISDLITGHQSDAKSELGQLLDALRQLQATSTDLIAAMHPRAINSVLQVETFVFPASGVIQRDWPVACGSLVVAALGTHSVTVVAGSQVGQTAPLSGVGVSVVPANSWMSIPIATTAITLYGTSGDTASIQVFAGLASFGRR